MSQQIQEYWRTVRLKQEELAASGRKVLFLTSLSNPSRGMRAGVTVECDLENAARRLVEGTHRIASDEEIEGFQQLQVRNFERTAAVELRRKKVLLVTTPAPVSDGGAKQTGRAKG